MASIKIRIGAERDRSVDSVFASIEKRAALAARVVQKHLEGGFRAGMRAGAGGSGGAAGVRARVSEEERLRRAAAKREDDEKIRALKHRLRLERQEQTFKFKEELAQTRRVAQEKLGALRRANALALRNARMEERERRNFAERTSHRATRFLMPNAPIGSMVTRALGDFARGAGVDFSIAGSVARSVSLEQQAIAISNQGYVSAARDAQGRPTANATRVDPKAIMAQSREIASKYGLQAGDAQDALAAFAGTAGDLDLGRRILGDLAKLSAATGTNLGDMASAAANVSQQLEGLPDQGKLIYEVMKQVAGQGKLGAVEISDMSTQMARIAAAAGGFEGDRATNIMEMGALAQLARSTGGAPSAAEAARSVGGFANTLRKSARIKAFKEAGIDVFADAGHTTFKRPLKIIEESLLATGGDLQKMNKLFMDVVGARAVTGLGREFSRAGGGQAGIEAVRKEFDKLMQGAAMSDEEIEASARVASESRAAKAAKFQNQLDAIVEKVSGDLIPALDKLAPNILSLAEMVGGLAKWALNSPWTAAGAAVLAATLRAGLESAFRAGVERMVMSSNLPFLPGRSKLPPGDGGTYSRGAATVGAIGGLLGAAGLTLTALTIGSMVVEHMVAKEMERAKEEVDKEAEKAQTVKDIYERVHEGNLSPEVAKSLYGATGEAAAKGEMRRKDLETLERTEAFNQGGYSGRELFNRLETARDVQKKEVIDMVAGSNKEMAGQLKEIFYGNIKVVVMNPEAFKQTPGTVAAGTVRESPPIPGG